MPAEEGCGPASQAARPPWRCRTARLCRHRSSCAPRSGLERCAAQSRERRRSTHRRRGGSRAHATRCARRGWPVRPQVRRPTTSRSSMPPARCRRASRRAACPRRRRPCPPRHSVGAGRSRPPRPVARRRLSRCACHVARTPAGSRAGTPTSWVLHTPMPRQACPRLGTASCSWRASWH